MSLDQVKADGLKRPLRLAPYASLAALAAAIAISAGCGPAGVPQSETSETIDTSASDLYEAPGVALWPNGQVPVCLKTFGTSDQAGWLEWALVNSWGSVAKIDFQFSSTCPFPGKTNYIEVMLVDQFTDSNGVVHDINSIGAIGGRSGVGMAPGMPGNVQVTAGVETSTAAGGAAGATAQATTTLSSCCINVLH